MLTKNKQTNKNPLECLRVRVYVCISTGRWLTVPPGHAHTSFPYINCYYTLISSFVSMKLKKMEVFGEAK